MWFKDYKKNLLIFALLAWILFLVLELSARIQNLYQSLPLIDLPVHFLSGIAAFSIIFWALTFTKIRRKPEISVFFTMIIALMWEFMEKFEEWYISSDPPYLQDHFFWDGFFDVTFGVLGAIFALALLFMLSRRAKWLRGLKF